jgi:hypothetical protein
VNEHPVATRALSVGGVLLLVVAAIHLAVTPLVRTLFSNAASTEAARFWLAPFLLNHIVAGILLVPVALNTLYAARAARRGAAWARTVALINAVSVLLLPLTLVALMGPAHLRALPFLVASVLITIAGVVLVTAALSLGRDEPRSSEGETRV